MNTKSFESALKRANSRTLSMYERKQAVRSAARIAANAFDMSEMVVALDLVAMAATALWSEIQALAQACKES